MDEETGYFEDTYFQIIECQGCDTISYRTLTIDSQSIDLATDFGGEPWSETLYPRRTNGELPLKQLFHTPTNIRKIYRETIDAINNDLYILGSGGLRAIIEGICKDKKIRKGEVTDNKGIKSWSTNLDGKIEGLAAHNFLTTDNAKVLHQLRFLGNEALHELSAPSKAEFIIAISIIEQVIESIYELIPKAMSLKAAKAKRQK